MVEKDEVQGDSVQFNVEELNFHPLLKDIENIFWFFILSNKTLSHPDVQNVLKREGDGTVLAMLKKYNEWVDLDIEIKDSGICTSKMNIKEQMIFIGRAITIITYEFLLASEYREAIEKDEEFRFLRCIRNAATHDNKFDFKYKYGRKKGEWLIEDKEVIKWGNMKITRELQSKNVFNDFISVFTLFLLVKHFSEELKQIDRDNKP